MTDGKIIRYNCSWFYLRKKHFCHSCDTVLERKKREVIVNSNSEEAKNYDFSVADLYLYGNVKFVIFYFYCPKCGAIYEISELKMLEKMRKTQRFNSAECSIKGREHENAKHIDNFGVR